MKLWKKTVAAAVVGMGVLTAGPTVCADSVITQGVSINGVDVSGMTYDEAKGLIDQKVAEAQSSTITVQVGTDSVEATAVDLGLQWKNRNVVREALGLGNSGNLIKRYKDVKDLAREPKQLELIFAANDSAVRRFIEEKCKQYEKEPQEASISSDGAGGIDYQEGVVGQVINVDESAQALENYIADEWHGGGGEVSLVVEMEEPKASSEDLASITDILGTYTTYYGSTYGRNTNVERGAELINGYLISPGDTFSVCDHLVPFTAENGYELGGAYENGRVVQEYGGGICQVSTTLYNALLLAEIEIVERHNHTMSVTYVPTSMDAAIAEGSMDLIFRNNLDTPIFISGYAYGGELTFTVWGKETRPADRYVTYDSETTSTLDAPTTPVLYPAPDQNVGYFSQVQTAMAGSTAVLYKYVTQNGETTVEQVNSSTYQATPTSYEVGTLGASDALLNAIYANDLAAAQLAATGVVTVGNTAQTESETTQSETTEQTETNAYTETNTSVYVEPSDGYYVDTPDGEVYVGGTGQDGVVTW